MRKNSAILALIQSAKNSGSHWADAALAELESLTGDRFAVNENLRPGMNQPRYEIERVK